MDHLATTQLMEGDDTILGLAGDDTINGNAGCDIQEVDWMWTP